MKKEFSEGFFFSILTNIGNLIILSILWIIGCIPIITIGCSTSALYYVVVKSVRNKRGYPAREFLKAYKHNFKKGIILTVIGIAWILLMVINIRYSISKQSSMGTMLIVIYIGFLIVGLAIMMYVFPVLSRFSMKIRDIFKLSFVMAIRYLPLTILIFIVTLGVVFIQYRFLPLILIVVSPGIWCFGISYITEYVIKAYIPKSEADKEIWYNQ